MMKDITAGQKTYEYERSATRHPRKEGRGSLKKNPRRGVKFLTDYSNAHATKVVTGLVEAG
jgi:hypothetical protein